MEPTAITLGGKEYRIRPLTLGQLRKVLPLFATAASGFATEDSMDAGIDIIAAALSRDHPGMTRDALLDTETTTAEMAAALNAIAEISGLVKKDQSSGEAPAAESTGEA